MAAISKLRRNACVKTWSYKRQTGLPVTMDKVNSTGASHSARGVSGLLGLEGSAAPLNFQKSFGQLSLGEKSEAARKSTDLNLRVEDECPLRRTY